MTLEGSRDIPSFMSSLRSKQSKTNSNSKRTLRSAQLQFQSSEIRNELRFGGSLMKKVKGRTARPVSSKDPMHLVLRSSRATGRFGFAYKSNLKRVNELVRKACDRYGVKLILYSNNYNHLHLLVKFPSRAVYLRFIRSLTGALALAVCGASKLKAISEILGAKKFWDYRPFSRVVRSKRGYQVAKDYVVLNQLEALEILPKRSGRLRDVASGEMHLFR